MEAVAINDHPSTNASGNEDGPLVAVTFQKKPFQTQKYLEAEPKALGLTQITLSVFQISMVLGILMSTTTEMVTVEALKLIGPLFAFIAGSIAIAAQNLHLPTLKACLGMQVAACVASAISVIVIPSTLRPYFPICWQSMYNETSADKEIPKICNRLVSGLDHYNAELLLMNIAVLAMCVTLAVYCCKVINCCIPRASMPVITVSAPPAQSLTEKEE